jgi:PAS domain-containing protein
MSNDKKLEIITNNTFNINEIKRQMRKYRFLVISAVLGFVYWFIESIIDSIFFYEGRFIDLFFPTTIHEIWMRTTGLIFILGFGFFIQTENFLRRKSEEVKQSSEIRYFALFNNMIDGFAIHKMIYDKNGKPIDYVFKDINPSFTNLTGLTREMTINKRVTTIIPGIGNDPADWLGRYGNVAMGGPPISFEDFSEGLGKWFLITAYSPEKDFFVAIFTDITMKKSFDLEREQLAKFPTENPNPVLRVFRDGVVKFKNKASIPVLNHWNYTEEKGVLGEKWVKIITEVLKTGASREIEEEFGGKFTSLTFTPLKKTGEVNIYGLDITKRKKSEQELHELNLELEKRVLERTRQLENINSELQSFSYSVSHDLRAPLRSISGFSQAIMEDYKEKLDNSGRDFLTRIRSGCEKMGELIEDLLELSRISRTKMHIDKVDLSSIASIIVEDLRKQSPDRKNVEFTIQENVFADGDKNLLGLVLQNLLENSNKLNPLI